MSERSWLMMSNWDVHHPLLLNIAIEFVDLPINSMVIFHINHHFPMDVPSIAWWFSMIFHRFFYVYQRVLLTSLHSWLRLYYWDDRDGVAFCGWWFGPKIGGDQAGETRWKLWKSTENQGLAHVKPMKMWRTWWLKLCGLKHEIFRSPSETWVQPAFTNKIWGDTNRSPGFAQPEQGGSI